MRFLIEISDTNIYRIEVDADNEEEARDMAWNRFLLMDERERERVFHDADGDSRVVERAWNTSSR